MQNETQNISQEDIEQTKGLAWLSYLSILFIIPLIVNKDSQFTKFHVNQGIVLFIIQVIMMIVSGIGGFLIFAIPAAGLILTMFTGLIGLGMFILAIMGIVNAAQGVTKRLPVIGNITILK